jgi:hypothetical protein
VFRRCISFLFASYTDLDIVTCSPSPQNSPSSTTLCWRGRAVLTDPDSSGRAPTGAFAGSPLLCWLLRAAVLQPGFQSAAPCGVQACRKLGVVEITAHGLRHSAATILLNHVEKYAIVLRGSLSESRITSEPAILRKIASPSTRGLARDPQRRQRSPDNRSRNDSTMIREAGCSRGTCILPEPHRRLLTSLFLATVLSTRTFRTQGDLPHAP